MMGMSSYDAWVTREPEWRTVEFPEECLACGKPLAHNNTCGYCFRKDCRDEMRAGLAAEKAYEDALYADYIAEQSECLCHRDSDAGSHELCCGHQDGINPNCPQHGDGSS